MSKAIFNTAEENTSSDVIPCFSLQILTPLPPPINFDTIGNNVSNAYFMLD